MTLRTRRLGSLIQAELANLLSRTVKDPRLQLVTLTGVDVAPDLRQAKVFFTLFNEENRKDAEKGFKMAAPFLRSQLAKVLYLKTVPKLIPVFDSSIGFGVRMENLIKQARVSDETLEQTLEDER